MTPLPPVSVPFFAPVPFEVKADLYKLGTRLVGTPEETLFYLDAAYPDYVRAKLELLSHHPEHARCYLRDDQDALSATLWQLAALLASDQPAYFTFTAGCFSSRLLGLGLCQRAGLIHTQAAHFPELTELCFKHLQRLEPLDRLCDFLALAVQEDLVIMHKTGAAATADRAECLLVALPSHWDPAAKLGLDFGAIHAPVADKAPLLKAQGNLLKAMTRKGPFVRYNWNLASTPALAQNPALMASRNGLEQLSPEALLNTLYFRVERQTLQPFPALQRGLFAIRIFQEPLAATLNSAARKAQFVNMLGTMSAALLHYKGIDRYQEGLLEALTLSG